MLSGFWRWWNAWIRGDRLRTSPTERVWLQLKPPSIVLWEGERIEVLHRREIATEQGVQVELECLTPRGRETLIILPGDLHRPPTWTWK